MTLSNNNLQDINQYLCESIDGDGRAAERVAYALANGADVCARKDETIPLMRAVRDGHLAVAQVLLTQRMREQIGATDVFNRHALFNVLCTPQRHFKEMAELLIGAGADLNHRDVFGNSIMDYVRAEKFAGEHPEAAAWLAARLSQELVPQVVTGPVNMTKGSLRLGARKP